MRNQRLLNYMIMTPRFMMQRLNQRSSQLDTVFVNVASAWVPAAHLQLLVTQSGLRSTSSASPATRKRTHAKTSGFTSRPPHAPQTLYHHIPLRRLKFCNHGTFDLSTKPSLTPSRHPARPASDLNTDCVLFLPTGTRGRLRRQEAKEEVVQRKR